MNIINQKAEISRLKTIIANQENQINDLDKQLSDSKCQLAEYMAKEQSIASALEFAVERSAQIDATSYKLHELDIQRSRLLYMSLENALRKIYAKYPELKKVSLVVLVANLKAFCMVMKMIINIQSHHLSQITL